MRELSERDRERFLGTYKKYAGAAQSLNAFFVGESLFEVDISADHTCADVEAGIERIKDYCLGNEVTHRHVDDIILSLQKLLSILPA